MTGLEKITERILDDAKSRARGILEEAQAECERLAAEYAEKAKAMRQRVAEETERECADVVARARSAAAMAQRDIIEGTRASLLDSTFDAARVHLREMGKEKYRELLSALVVCAMLQQAAAEDSAAEDEESLPPATYEVRLNAADREAFGHRAVEDARRVLERRVGAARAAKLVLGDKTARIDGGIVLLAGDIEINCSLAVLIDEIRPTLEGDVAKLLFEKNEN